MGAITMYDGAYLTRKDMYRVTKKYGETAIRDKKEKTANYINAVVAGPEPDLILETAKVKRLLHEVNNPEEISDEEWYRMQLRFSKKGFDEILKAVKIMKAVYDLNHDIKIAHTIRKTVCDISLLQDGIRPADMSDEAAAIWEQHHGKLMYKFDGVHIISNSGKAKYTPEQFEEFRNDNKIVKAMMAAADTIAHVEEGDDEYDR
jgi:hypothetical protein